jgi:ATP-dependent Clp protease ATP-binding subunit ClpC
VRIVALQPSSLVAGAKFAGQLEERVKAVLAEAEQPGIILFIDELHSIVGSGGLVGSTDIGAQLKPALARGVSCIGATTDDEYRRFIERDRALERRFRPIAVEEMSPADTLMVLDAHRDLLWELRGVEVPDEVLQWLLDFCEDFLRNRVFPDKAVDLLEQCVATAVMNDESAVDVPRASAVAQEMVGMPIDLGGRLASLARRLTGAALLDADGSEELLERVGITMRGLDLHPSRPNAVILLADRAAESTEELAVAIAETLLGDPGRVVEFDFGQLDRSEDVNTLLGAPPAYIGFGEHLPLHDLARMPWSVLVCKNVDGCHPQVLEVLAQALEDGFLTERSGRRIYLSDAVVILSAPSKAAAKRPPGFPGRCLTGRNGRDVRPGGGSRIEDPGAGRRGEHKGRALGGRPDRLDREQPSAGSRRAVSGRGPEPGLGPDLRDMGPRAASCPPVANPPDPAGRGVPRPGADPAPSRSWRARRCDDRGPGWAGPSCGRSANERVRGAP